MTVELGREPTGETISLRELLEESGNLPVTIGNQHGPWYVVLSSRPGAPVQEMGPTDDEPNLIGRNVETVDLEVQFPDGGRGERLQVPVDQDVEVFE